MTSYAIMRMLNNVQFLAYLSKCNQNKKTHTHHFNRIEFFICFIMSIKVPNVIEDKQVNRPLFILQAKSSEIFYMLHSIQENQNVPV